MFARYSVRRLFIAVILSQAMAAQGLLANWGGALAVAAEFKGAFSAICSGGPENPRTGGAERPAKPDTHLSCFDVCIAGHAAAHLSGFASSVVRSADYVSKAIAATTPQREIANTEAFLPRGPPALV